MQCSNGHYSVSDMQDLMLPAGAACGHMFPTEQDGQLHHHQHHQQQQQYQQRLQQQEMLELYHVQAGVQDEHHLSPPELHSTHILSGFPHLPHKPINSRHPISHQRNFDLERAAEKSLSSLPAPGSPMNYAGVAQYIKPLDASVSTTDTCAEEYSESGPDKGAVLCRWSRQETLALLQIRSEMEVMFRDCNSKEVLWEEVSRKLFDAGFQRSAKKCREMLDNVHKYCKKTKDGIGVEKQEGKAYRFYTELEAIYSANQADAMDAAMAVADGGTNALFSTAVGNSVMRQQPEGDVTFEVGKETSMGPNSSSSTSCGNAAQAGHGDAKEQISGNKRKRKSWKSMKSFCEDLARQLMERQDALHRTFLEALERREEERVRREEAYKRQEMARISREQDLRAREQALATTRDAALVAFLHKMTGETLHLPEMAVSVAADAAAGCNNVWEATTPSGEEPSEGFVDANSKRWPNVEVLALIRVRTSLEHRFQEAGAKSQLWGEVSSSLASLGFSRSGKRCKEKWENINKYYRKTKDSVGRKLRPESAAKTCPYFHQLELLYERGMLTSPYSSSGVDRSALKLDQDAPQISGELKEASSKDEILLAASVLPDYQLQMSASVQTPNDTRAVANDVFKDGHSNRSDAELESADPVSVICRSSHVSDMAHEQGYGQEHTANQVIAGVLNCEEFAFVRGMMDNLHHNHQRLTEEQPYKRLELLARHSPKKELQNSIEEQDVDTTLYQQEGTLGVADDQDSSTLMALVHKLASRGGHPYDYLSSPATPE